jgi:Fe(II)/alpha-ketoglutarate-dependent arginine beta-hydroxylase
MTSPANTAETTSQGLLTEQRANRYLSSYEFSTAESDQVDDLLDRLSDHYATPETLQFLEDAPTLAHELPISLRRFINAERLADSSSLLHLRGHRLDDDEIGPTPLHWRERPRPHALIKAEMLLLLVGSLLGDVFGWSSQQDGRVIYDVLPIREHAAEQLGSSSAVALTLHTEDPFHPCRADYIGLGCLRNHDGVATSVVSVHSLELDPHVRSVLAEERFLLRPDESHSPESFRDPDSPVFELLRELVERPQPTAVLTGPIASPMIRVDFDFMNAQPGDGEAAAALEALQHALQEALTRLVLRQGEMLFMDNHRAVHGREPFQARYDGTDRWLKRINITRDLRKSRPWRGLQSIRTIG